MNFDAKLFELRALLSVVEARLRAEPTDVESWQLVYDQLGQARGKAWKMLVAAKLAGESGRKKSSEVRIYEAQAREDARAKAEGREPRLIARVEEISDEDGAEVVRYALDAGDGASLVTLPELLAANPGLAPEVVDEIRLLAPGETYRGGGGAAGSWTVTRRPA